MGTFFQIISKMFFLVFLGRGKTFRVKSTRLYSRYGTLPKGARIGAYLESLRASGMTPEPISDESGSNPRFSLVDTFILRTFSILIGGYIYFDPILDSLWWIHLFWEHSWFSLVDTFILRTFSILIGGYIYLENILYFHWLNPESWIRVVNFRFNLDND